MKVPAIAYYSAAIASAHAQAHSLGGVHGLSGRRHNKRIPVKSNSVTHSHSHSHHDKRFLVPSPRQISLDQARLKILLEKAKRAALHGRRSLQAFLMTCEGIQSEEIVIDTYYNLVLDVIRVPTTVNSGTGFEEKHVVPHPTDIWEDLTRELERESPDINSVNEYLGRLSTVDEMKEVIVKQTEVLNRDFAVNTPFQFRCVNCDDPNTVANANYARLALTFWDNIGAEIAEPGLTNLNIFVVGNIGVDPIVEACKGDFEEQCLSCLRYGNRDDCDAFIAALCGLGLGLFDYYLGVNEACDYICTPSESYYADLCEELCPVAACCAEKKNITLCSEFPDGVDTLSEFLDEEEAYDILGGATLPSFQKDGKGDGFMSRYDTLPGGGFVDVDLGQTGTHEVGHWLGLYHIFQADVGFEEDPCNPSNRNDYILDTPVMGIDTVTDGSAYINCEDILSGELDASDFDTCPAIDDDKDLIFNHMNYLSHDACFSARGHFTCGQVERMYAQWKLYREMVTDCDEGQKEVDIIIDYDPYHTETHVSIVEKASGSTIFDSDNDIDSCAPFESGGGLLINVCLIMGTYTLTVTDEGKDGFSGKSGVEIFVADSSSGSITGDFGESSSLDFTVKDSESDSETPSSATIRAQSAALINVGIVATWLFLKSRA